MRYRLFGRTGLRVSELFLGTMGFATDDARRLVDVYAAAGGNVIDTANSYGDSELVVGKALEGRRDRFVLATKYTCSTDTSDPNAAGNHRKNLVRSLDDSLRRLRTDHVDVYWVHVWDRHTPVEETMRALDDAVRAGKILYTGVSDTPAWIVSQANTLADWRGWTPFAGLQVPYNLLNRDAERDLLPMAEAFGLTTATWGPLAGGKLSAAASGTRFAESDLSRSTFAVREVAAELGATPAQVAIAWCRAKSRTVHPIIGASTVEQLTDNLGAVDVVLPPEAVARLDSGTDFAVGFPSEFIAQCERHPEVFGEAYSRLDGR
ncbi:aldo/keto reductase [Umezawaea sp. Da 62-37]|uniref:aldo/keto reductase n=1 Tax=Umezawaea sp. Da 62-37 TaxID=3075927 RepID=UPI0028F6D957|nr:aldo/keto reductase [Umezawaea sp. Da 62-37]WNV83208.1 aldo/keto reductase [Umezawaea sp. Da 62-37]